MNNKFWIKDRPAVIAKILNNYKSVLVNYVKHKINIVKIVIN